MTSSQGLVAEDVEIPTADRDLFGTDLQSYKRAVSEETQGTEFEIEVADSLVELGYL